MFPDSAPAHPYTTHMKRLWRWLRSHFVPLPQPDITHPPQADPQDMFVGFRWWFK